jgi:hypothetical protein
VLAEKSCTCIVCSNLVYQCLAGGVSLSRTRFWAFSLEHRHRELRLRQTIDTIISKLGLGFAFVDNGNGR